MELFKIQNLSFTYPEQEEHVLNDVSITLNQGDFAVLAGSSGCGKSTLLNIISGQITDYTGILNFQNTVILTLLEQAEVTLNHISNWYNLFVHVTFYHVSSNLKLFFFLLIC